MCKNVLKNATRRNSSGIFKKSQSDNFTEGVFKKSQSDNFTEGVFKNIIKKLYLY